MGDEPQLLVDGQWGSLCIMLMLSLTVFSLRASLFCVNFLAVRNSIRINCSRKACRFDFISFLKEGAKLFPVLFF